MEVNTKRITLKRKKYNMEKQGARITASIWSLSEKVALACQILYEAGHDAGLSGQITARIDDTTFITQRLGFGFDEISVSNLLIVDHSLTVLSGEGVPNPANCFHGWIYRERPDVNCIVHTHPVHTSALSMLETPLVVSHMDSCALYDDVAFLPRWPGVPVGNNEGEIITAALGDKRAILLGHHGLLTASGSVEESCLLALQFERTARMQLLAKATGEQLVCIDPALAKQAHDWLLRPSRIDLTFAYYARRALARDESCLH